MLFLPPTFQGTQIEPRIFKLFEMILSHLIFLFTILILSTETWDTNNNYAIHENHNHQVSEMYRWRTHFDGSKKFWFMPHLTDENS